MPADYSEEEMYVLKQLISDACEAEEFFSLDELEEYSTKMRGENLCVKKHQNLSDTKFK